MKPKERLNPVKEFRVYRRNLPHLELPGSVYFITFNTAKRHSLSDTAKNIIISSFKFHADKKYKLHACVVMDTHVHCVLQPMEKSIGAFYGIAQIMHSIKSYSANRIQRLLNIQGSVWQDENYDRIIRDEKEYLEKMNYIVNNPLKARIVEKPEDYRWLFVEGLG
jgi:putative transposase